MPSFTRSKQERALFELFDEAFQTKPPPGRGEHGFLIADIVERSHAGLRLEYSVSTATWLNNVIENPNDFGLVYNFLAELLSSPQQPLGDLARRFAVHCQQVFMPATESLPTATLRGGWSNQQHVSVLAAAANAMQLGVARLHQLTLDVLPPLQCYPAAAAAKEAVQAVLFEMCAPTLEAVIARTASAKDASLQARLAQLGRLLPHDVGLPRRFWLEDEVRVALADAYPVCESEDDDVSTPPRAYRLHDGIFPGALPSEC